MGGNTEQEYDAAADMMDDPEAETPGPGPYSTVFGHDSQPMTLSATTAAVPAVHHHMPMADAAGSAGGAAAAPHGPYPSMTQLLDPGLDWDPFGLSASMQFPTQFTFDTSNMR